VIVGAQSLAHRDDGRRRRRHGVGRRPALGARRPRSRGAPRLEAAASAAGVRWPRGDRRRGGAVGLRHRQVPARRVVAHRRGARRGRAVVHQVLG